MTRRAAALLVASLLAVPACSDAEDPQPKAPTSSSGSPASSPTESDSATDVPDDDPSETATPGVADRLPAGSLVNRLVVPVPKPKADVLSYPSAAFTDRYVVAMTATSMLRVIDRTTFEEVWSTKIKPRQGSGPCVLPQLARDAEYVTLFVGLDCERLMTFELATGRPVVDRTVDGIGVDGYGRVGDQTFWTDGDSINTIDEDGDTVQYADLDQLGITDSDSFRTPVNSSALEGSDVVVMELSDITTGVRGTTRLAGVDVGGDEPAVAFDLPVARLGLPGGKPREFQLLDRPGGLFRAQLGNGRWAFGTVDPETGSAAGHTVVLPKLSTGGVPAMFQITDVYTVSGNVVVMGLMAKQSAGVTAHLARYDLDRGTETWRSLIPPTQDQPKTGVAIHVIATGFAADGEHAYATYSAGGLQTDLVEVDLETGEQTGRWPKVDDKIFGGDVYVDGDLVVGVASRIYQGGEPELVIKQVS